jgi:hypothetical protein
LTDDPGLPSSASFLASLSQVPQILPPEKLSSLESLSKDGKLTDETLVTTLGEQGLVLIAFGLAAANNSLLLSNLSADQAQALAALGEHIKRFSPALLEHPKIREMAKGLLTEPSPRDAKEEKGKNEQPFDDISGMRAIPTYLDSDGVLTPTIRAQISFTNRAQFPPISLRLFDVSFLAWAFLSSLAHSLESSARVAKAGLLDEEELHGVRNYLEDFDSEIRRIKAALGEANSIDSGNDSTR